MVSFTPRPLYLPKLTPGTLWIGEWAFPCLECILN
jgi:hypothetical protein